MREPVTEGWGDVWVCRWWWQRRLIAEINENAAAAGGECPYFLCTIFYLFCRV
jgi:hypothetical protein